MSAGDVKDSRTVQPAEWNHQSRVALVLPNLMIGGAEHQALKLLAALPSIAACTSLVLLQGWKPVQLRDAVPRHVKVAVSPYGRRDPRVIPWLAALLRRERTQLVQAFLWHAEFIAAMACKLAPGVLLVGSERGDRAEPFYGTVQRALDRMLIFPSTVRFVANSHSSFEALCRAGYRAAHIDVIRNGVELMQAVDSSAVLHGLPADAFIACTVSSLRTYKGIDTLVRAIAACQADLGIYALVVGEGPEQRRLADLAVELGVAERVRFAGRQWPAEPWMRAADVGVLASTLSEASSNSVLEFMAAGRAVFATAVGGTPELVVDGVTGRLFRPNNWQELARLLEDGARDRRGLQEMGRRAHERVVSNFSITAAAAEYAKLWRDVIAQRRAGANQGKLNDTIE